MTNWWEQQLDNCGEVDGVDFVPLFFNPKKQKAPNEIYQTNTYEELTTKDVSVPRTNWLPWRMIDGKKFYLDKLGNIIEGPKFEWIKEYDKEEYWGYWILHSCGASSPAYAKHCCGCGKEISWIHEETKEEYLKRII